MLKIHKSKLDTRIPKSNYCGKIKTLKCDCEFEDKTTLKKGTKIKIVNVQMLYTTVQIPKWKFQKAILAHNVINWK